MSELARSLEQFRRNQLANLAADKVKREDEKEAKKREAAKRKEQQQQLAPIAAVVRPPSAASASPHPRSRCASAARP